MAERIKKSPKVKPVPPAREGSVLLPGEETGAGFRRILGEELAVAVRHASVPREEISKGIHELRKTLKRIRAVLRLMEPDIGHYLCRKEVIRYRDIARRVASLRMLYVSLETIKKLRTQLPRRLSEEPLKQTESLLLAQYENLLKKKIDNKEILEVAWQELMAALQQMESFPQLHNDIMIAEKAIRDTFRKGRKCWRKVARKANSVNIHELRKHIKQLQFQLQILSPLKPDKLEKPLVQLQKMARLSGDEHDLYELNLFIKKHLKDEPYKKELMFRISRLMLKNRKQFLPAARKFYGIKSKKFIAILELSKPENLPAAEDN